MNAGTQAAIAAAMRAAEPRRVRRVLAIKVHDQLGDFLVATPALHALRRRFPEARLALVTRAMLAPLARRNRDLDRVWVMPRLRGPADAARLAAVIAGVAAFRPDLAFVLNSVSRSKTADALARLSGARLIVGRSRVGAGPLPADAPADPFEAPLAGDRTYGLDLGFARGSEHQVDRLLDLVSWTGATTDDLAPRLDLADDERAAGAARVAPLAPGAGPLVGIHPGAANPLKCWPIESFAALGAALASEGCRIVVFDSREVGRAASIVDGLRAHGITTGLVPVEGIDRFAAECAALDLLVCNDSGVLHVATALRVPTVSFHSLGRPQEWAPRSDKAAALWVDRAIETIPVDTALIAARRLLAAPRSEGSYRRGPSVDGVEGLQGATDPAGTSHPSGAHR